jgi:integrase
MAALSLEFLILTAARSGEVLFAKREEVQDTCWTIPGDRMKAGREHRVPLCPRALALIAKAKELNPDSEYFFSLTKRPMSNMVMTQLLRRMNAGVTAHGFRSSFRDWVSEETQHSREVAEMALAHTIDNKVESAYRRGNLFEKRRKLMQDWEDYCLGKQSEDNLKSLLAA